MKGAHARPPRRRAPIREPYKTLPLDSALQVVELLAAEPTGLTIPEIVARFRSPARQVIRTIAVMQQRKWLRTNPHGDRLTLGHRLSELCAAC